MPGKPLKFKVFSSQASKEEKEKTRREEVGRAGDLL